MGYRSSNHAARMAAPPPCTIRMGRPCQRKSSQKLSKSPNQGRLSPSPIQLSVSSFLPFCAHQHVPFSLFPFCPLPLFLLSLTGRGRGGRATSAQLGYTGRQVQPETATGGASSSCLLSGWQGILKSIRQGGQTCLLLLLSLAELGSLCSPARAEQQQL